MKMLKKWWHNAVCYQIYPKSFYDSNGDGIGDLRGIIQKLDHLAELGVDILWLSPVYVSPLADQGYDIADYRNIDPRFGTMEDMDELLTEAHARGIHVLMDLVVNHCSDEHEWFRKACEDPDGKYGQFFYIETIKDGKLPTNWRSYFGGPVWDRLPGHDDKVYLHVFHRKQPDLNWENPSLREEVYDVINWWLEKGLDGFRLDAIINIKKALPFRDYDEDRTDGMADIHKMLHDASGIGDFLSELRDRTFRPHGAFTVGEVFDVKEDEIANFIGPDGYFSSMFDFSDTVFGQSQLGWHHNKDISPDEYRDCVFAAQKKIGTIGFISNIIENHDEPRGVSRYIPEGDLCSRSKKLLATVYFFLKGLPWIYQGQELGMENLPLSSIDDVDDISAKDNYQVALAAGISEKDALHMIEKYGRDNARTPFQWDDSMNAGFTTGKPWLKVNPNYKQINLANEKKDPNSVFCYYKKLCALRKDERFADILAYGELIPYLADRKGVMAYWRKIPVQEGSILVAANFQKETQTLPLPFENGKLLLCNTETNPVITKDEITLLGYQCAVFFV